MPAVQEHFGRMRSPRVKKSIWIVIDDVPCEGDDLDKLRIEIQHEAKKLAEARRCPHTMPSPACVASSGIAETNKLQIVQLEKAVRRL